LDTELLISKTLAGETSAFDQLVERYRPWISNKINTTVRNRYDVEDLVQETFCKAFEELPTLRTPAFFGPWLGRIAANITASWWRRRQRWHHLVEEGKATDKRRVEQPDEIYERHQLGQYVITALAQISPVQRQALQQFYYEGQSYKQIADEAEITVDSIHFRLMKGRKEVRRHLKQAVVGRGDWRDYAGN
jgi:RNA polymerase sigma-70 factor, ECF subfamily